MFRKLKKLTPKTNEVAPILYIHTWYWHSAAVTVVCFKVGLKQSLFAVDCASCSCGLIACVDIQWSHSRKSSYISSRAVMTRFVTLPLTASVDECMLSQYALQNYIVDIIFIVHCVSWVTVILTLSTPIPLRLYTLPYWSNRLFLIFDILALWCSVLSARAPVAYVKYLKRWLDQYAKV